MTIKPIGLFNTPTSWDALMDWIKAHRLEDQAHLMTAAGMAWNLACETTKDDAD